MTQCTRTRMITTKRLSIDCGGDRNDETRKATGSHDGNDLLLTKTKM
jgi:hypothetical protein